MRWLLLVPLFAAVEIALLILVGYAIGIWPTLGLLAVAALVGVFFARAEGLRVWSSYREALAEGRMPEEGILSGLLVLLGGALLLLPGFLSDLAGIALMIPWSRRRVADRVRAYLTAKMGSLHVVNLATDLQDFGAARPEPWYEPDPGPRGDVIDTEGVVVQSERLLGTGGDDASADADPVRRTRS